MSSRHDRNGMRRVAKRIMQKFTNALMRDTAELLELRATMAAEKLT